ncbi:MAG: ATP-grasp domain-containing protein [Patescibacteria group bacterium]|nr:ATP-grasp domain-containing protein [Patescibacteria group bacterium]
MNELMADSLSRRFGGEYKPIYVFSSHPNKHVKKENYIVLNERADSLERELKKKVVYPQEYEDLNEEFARCSLVKKISESLFAKQTQIPVYSFTTSFLKFSDPRWLLLGPSPSISTFYDNKIEQYKVFKRLGLSRNDARIFENKEELLRKNNMYPGYITASYTSGGNESGLIYSKEMLHNFLSRLRDVNKRGRFLVAHVFEHIVAMPNVNAIVTGEDKTNVLIISDQIMRGTRYLGNVYPTSIAPKHIELIKQVAMKIGNFLSQKGYRGLFGCDFLINDKGKLVIVDLNPRRQGGYVCNALALKTVGINLTDIELSCALREEVSINLDYEKIQYPGTWAHLKVKPYFTGQDIVQEIAYGDVQKIFSKRVGQFYRTFYRKGSLFIDGYIGYVVSVGKKREKVFRFVNETSDKILRDTLL